ncbi:MAG: transposase [Candidatus Heimdallarchaeota archaeon]|nr:transposase [Candidatus Heimdallarchaeota archaeon]
MPEQATVSGDGWGAIISKTCKELEIEVIDMSVSPDHIHLFIQYPPKYSVSFIAKRLKVRRSRI